jgi:hypothetical protein
MGETTDQIERQIEQKRNQLSENFTELEQKVKSAVDWRTQFGERPGTMLAIAFGGGMLLSAMLGGTRSSRNSSWDTSRRASERVASGRDYASTASTAVYKSSAADSPRKASHARENFETLSAALLSVALSRATNLINSYLPGFEREFTRMQASKASDRTDRGYSTDRSYSESPSERSWPNANTASTD